MKFVVYSKSHCPFCDKAKMLIKNKGHEMVENKLGIDFQVEELKEMFPNAKTFPQIVLIGETNQHIGGCDDLEKFFSVGELSL